MLKYCFSRLQTPMLPIDSTLGGFDELEGRREPSTYHVVISYIHIMSDCGTTAHHGKNFVFSVGT